MKTFLVGVTLTAVALVTGLVFGMYLMHAPVPVQKQAANAFARRDPPRIETSQPAPETTGVSTREPREASPNPAAEPKVSEISAAQKKNDASERKKAERKAREQARKQKARRQARDAYASDSDQPQQEFGSFQMR